jgi:hypothetical protein
LDIGQRFQQRSRFGDEILQVALHFL